MEGTRLTAADVHGAQSELFKTLRQTAGRLFKIRLSLIGATSFRSNVLSSWMQNLPIIRQEPGSDSLRTVYILSAISLQTWMGSVFVCQARCHEEPRAGWRKTTESSFFPVWEARGPRSRYGQGEPLPRATWGAPVPGSFP